jgi:hypothetical protein
MKIFEIFYLHPTDICRIQSTIVVRILTEKGIKAVTVVSSIRSLLKDRGRFTIGSHSELKGRHDDSIETIVNGKGTHTKGICHSVQPVGSVAFFNWA